MLLIVAIVAARAGSVRLPNKALRPVGGEPMLARKVRQLRDCPSVSMVCVNTDSYKIGREALIAGATLMSGRDYGGDTAEMLRDSARKVPGETVLWAHPTNPLVRAETYEAAIAAYQDAVQAGTHDSLFSAVRIQRHAWQDGKPANFDPWGARHPLAAELAPYFFQDGAIFIQPRRAMIENGYFYGRAPLMFEIDAVEAVDVDTAEDYEAACRLCETERVASFG